jgi:hypothetical protein
MLIVILLNEIVLVDYGDMYVIPQAPREHAWPQLSSYA